MKYPKYLLSLILTMFCFSVFGQTDFRPGYYIQNDLDTIYGLLDYRGDFRNTHFCVFKSEENAEVETFEPEDIFSYRFSQGKFYVSKNIESEEGVKLVFAEYLVNGIADLYYFRDEKDDNYFLETEDGELKLLRNEESIIEQNGVSYVWKSNEHVATLKSTFADCMEIQPRLDKAKLTHESLITLTSDYHDYICNDGKCIIYQKDIPSVRANIGIIFGIASSGLRFVRHYTYEDYIFQRSMDPYIGLQLNLTSPRLNEKISLLIRSEWTKSYYHSYLEEINSAISTNHYDFHVRHNSIKFILGLQYTYPKGRFRPTIALGPLFNYNLVNDFRYTIERESPEMINTIEFSDNPLKDDTMGAFIQLGTDINLTGRQYINCNLRYHYTSETFGVRIILNSVSLNVGYFF